MTHTNSYQATGFLLQLPNVLATLTAAVAKLPADPECAPFPIELRMLIHRSSSSNSRTQGSTCTEAQMCSPDQEGLVLNCCRLRVRPFPKYHLAWFCGGSLHGVTHSRKSKEPRDPVEIGSNQHVRTEPLREVVFGITGLFRQ